MFIQNKTVRIFNFGMKMRLIPGVNDVSKWKNIKSIEGQLKTLEERGDIIIKKVEVEDDFAEGVLSPLNAGDAISIVKDTFDYDKLVEMKEEEANDKNRSTVIKALEVQIQMSEEALKNE